MKKIAITTYKGGTGKTTAEMKTKITFKDAGWNFYDTWNIIDEHTYPFLNWQGPVFNFDKGYNYEIIQDGIDYANSGNTICVLNGNYYENIVIDQTLTLIGEDKESTIIDGEGSGNVINIKGDWE